MRGVFIEYTIWSWAARTQQISFPTISLPKYRYRMFNRIHFVHWGNTFCEKFTKTLKTWETECINENRLNVGYVGPLCKDGFVSTPQAFNIRQEENRSACNINNIYFESRVSSGYETSHKCVSEIRSLRDWYAGRRVCKAKEVYVEREGEREREREFILLKFSRFLSFVVDSDSVFFFFF